MNQFQACFSFFNWCQDFSSVSCFPWIFLLSWLTLYPLDQTLYLFLNLIPPPARWVLPQPSSSRSTHLLSHASSPTSSPSPYFSMMFPDSLKLLSSNHFLKNLGFIFIFLISVIGGRSLFIFLFKLPAWVLPMQNDLSVNFPFRIFLHSTEI